MTTPNQGSIQIYFKLIHLHYEKDRPERPRYVRN